jgi:hypothetical protein
LNNKNLNNLNLCYLGFDFINFNVNFFSSKSKINNNEFIITINTNSKNKFASHFHLAEKSNKVQKNSKLNNDTLLKLKKDFNCFRRIKINMERISNYKNSKDYFENLESLYKKL